MPLSLAFSVAGLSSALADMPAIVSNGTPANFLRISEVLTANSELNPVLADRLWSAFTAVAPEVIPLLGKLSDLAAQRMDADTLMQAARGAGLSDAADALIAAWYTGTVGHGTKVEVVAYDLALMYGTVSDGLIPPTYVLGGPAWWTAPPPAAGVSKPVEKPAPAAPVTGTPLPQRPGSPPSLRQPQGSAP